MPLTPFRLSVFALTIGLALQPGMPAVAASAVPLSEDGKRWWEDVQYLASDKFEGRLTGSPGYERAAEYVAQQFKADGLRPAGSSGYFQPVKFDVQRVIAERSSLTLSDASGQKPLVLGDEAVLGTRLPQPKQIQNAPLVFIGYGLHIPDAGFDDFAGQDLHGKVLVYISGGPADIAGALKSHARASQEFWKVVEHSGALGVLSIPNPKSMDVPWSRIASSASQPGMRIADPALQDSQGPMFSANVNPAHADKLFSGTEWTFDKLLAVADSGKALPHFALGKSLTAAVSTESEQVESPNIAGVYPGSDPKLKNEYVVFSAHLDHLGIGAPINGDKLYNGAMDNASGVSSLLEIARYLHDSGTQVKRSILFVIVCGEEKGLLGSRYFAGKPTVPAKSMVADVNIDMFLPLAPLKILTVYGLDESTVGDDVRAVAKSMEVQVVADRQPDRNIFIRSDQYNFIREGVPAIASGFGSEPGSPEEAQTMAWLRTRYHAPSDDIDQPVNIAAAAKYNQLMLALAERIADAPERPEWKPNSFFRRFAKP